MFPLLSWFHLFWVFTCFVCLCRWIGVLSHFLVHGRQELWKIIEILCSSRIARYHQSLRPQNAFQVTVGALVSLFWRDTAKLFAAILTISLFQCIVHNRNHQQKRGLELFKQEPAWSHWNFKTHTGEEPAGAWYRIAAAVGEVYSSICHLRSKAKLSVDLVEYPPSAIQTKISEDLVEYPPSAVQTKMSEDLKRF